MDRYTTASGSIYEVDRDQHLIRQLARGAACNSQRIGFDWRPYETAEMCEGHLCIVWGRGRDAASADALQVGTEGAPDEMVTRTTCTSRVVKREEPA
jgi:hypothetical protein